MIKSMTGYGKELVAFGGKKITIEIKTINSKQFDLSLRMPIFFREKEMEIRNLLSNAVERGKTDVCISVESNEESDAYALNQPLAERYYRDLKKLSAAIGTDNITDYLSVITRLPDVFKPENTDVNPEEWTFLEKGLSDALLKLNRCRADEGRVLENDFILRVNNIISLLQQVQPFENERIANIRAKLRSACAEVEQSSGLDANRFEQELIYYFEKLDITEEKIRLQKHCNYFFETINDTASAGKKLGFIAQEMGREINTLGSKANHFEIQRLVVLMKDELEKIKEQLLNIL